LYNFLKNKDGSDKCIFILFDKNLQANKPLNIYHDELKDVDILILYGDRDWCPAKHGEEFKNMFSQNNVTIDYVKDSGHLIQTDNYDELSEKIIKYLTCLKSEYDIFYEKSENKENITTNVNSEDAVDELLFDML
jgi:pimeloyl-ACP methyl ester carboxylesterase